MYYYYYLVTPTLATATSRTSYLVFSTPHTSLERVCLVFKLAKYRISSDRKSSGYNQFDGMGWLLGTCVGRRHLLRICLVRVPPRGCRLFVSCSAVRILGYVASVYPSLAARAVMVKQELVILKTLRTFVVSGPDG